MRQNVALQSLSTPDDVRDLFRSKGWVLPEDSLEVIPMMGGVSCHTWKVVRGASRWILKQPLAQLDTEVVWYSDINRISREADSLRLLGRILDVGTVPVLQFVDEESYSIVMICAPENVENWKTQMMSGQFEKRTAGNAGALLAQIHERSKKISNIDQAKFEDIQYFEELRIEPFHKYLAQKYPGIRSSIGILIDELRNRRCCFTHGDYSPKNMLVNPDGDIILLDFEVAHWGNPVFDLAYCIAHLMLKGWALDREEDAGGQIRSFLDAYSLETGPLLPHLGLMLLARLDGTSTVDYLTDSDLRSDVRKVSMSWIKRARTRAPIESPRRSYSEISSALRC